MSEIFWFVVENVKGPPALLLLLAAILLGAIAFLSQFQPNSPLRVYTDEGLLVSIGLLIVAVVWAWVRTRRHKSYFADPTPIQRISDAFEGRDADVEQLSRDLKERSLVWLVGESGAGKSSLLTKGVLPELRKDPRLVAIYMDYWGTDWEAGPREKLTRELDQVLDDQTRQELGVRKPLQSEQLLPSLQSLHDKLGRLPVLLLDQFDDYLTPHRGKFIPGGSGRVLSVEELRAQNPLWDSIGALVAEGKLHCLFATRLEMQWGMDCVRFVAGERYYLPRLERGVARQLLEAATSGHVVAHRDRGWTQLEERLCDDLEEAGRVLPIQMRVAFQSLPALRPLTVGAYEAKGGLVGLEASHIGDRVSDAATANGLEAGQVRRVLLRMVDRETEKTIAVGQEQLFKVLDTSGQRPGRSEGSSGTDPKGPLQDALEYLKQNDIVRDRLEPGRSSPVWQLDHDYLARGVIELDRRESRWQHRLNDAARNFERAASLWNGWKALLGPWDQVRIAWESLRGRVRYAPHGRFAAWSTARLVLNFWVALAVMAAYGGSLWWTDQQAQGLFAEIGVRDEMTTTEAETLWEITHSSEAVRLGVIQTALESPANAKLFNLEIGFGDPRSDRVVQAVVGANRDLRLKVVEDVLRASLFRAGCFPEVPEDDDRIEACASLVLSLDKERSITPHFLVAAIEACASLVLSLDKERSITPHFLVAAMEKPRQTDSGQLRSLASGLGSLGEKLPAAQAAPLAQRLVAAMEKTTDSTQLFYLASGLGSLGEKLPAAHQAAAMEKTTDRDQLASWGVLPRIKSLIEPPAVGATAGGGHGKDDRQQSVASRRGWGVWGRSCPPTRQQPIWPGCCLASKA